MNSCRSTLLSACAPPLMMFIIGTGSWAASRPVLLIEAGTASAAAGARLPSRGAFAIDTPAARLAPRRPLFSVRAEVDQALVEAGWSAASAAQGCRRSPFTWRHRLLHALAEVAGLVAVAQLHRFRLGAGRCARGTRAAERASASNDIGFEGGIA